jgi:hypothetical protein
VFSLIREYNFNLHSAAVLKDVLPMLVSIEILSHILTKHEMRLEEMNVIIVDSKQPDKRQRFLLNNISELKIATLIMSVSYG